MQGVVSSQSETHGVVELPRQPMKEIDTDGVPIDAMRFLIDSDCQNTKCLEQIVAACESTIDTIDWDSALEEAHA